MSILSFLIMDETQFLSFLDVQPTHYLRFDSEGPTKVLLFFSLFWGQQDHYFPLDSGRQTAALFSSVF